MIGNSEILMTKMLPWLQNFEISKMDAGVNNEFQSSLMDGLFGTAVIYENTGTAKVNTMK